MVGVCIFSSVMQSLYDLLLFKFRWNNNSFKLIEVDIYPKPRDCNSTKQVHEKCWSGTSRGQRLHLLL